MKNVVSIFALALFIMSITLLTNNLMDWDKEMFFYHIVTSIVTGGFFYATIETEQEEQ